MIASALTQGQIDQVCPDQADLACRAAANFATSPDQLRLVKWLIDRPLSLLVIFVVAYLANRFARKVVQRWGRRMANGRLVPFRPGGDGADTAVARAENGRSVQRVETLLAVLSSTLTTVIWAVAFVVALGLFDINLAPLVAGAGIVGVALGFGAQSIVGDFLAGFFMLLEDQYGVGDIIDVGEATGVVESFSLRTTTLRDVNGTLWHVPNHEIRRVGNKSQVWSRAVLDVEVAYETNLRDAQRIILEVAEGLWRDETFEGGDIIEQPEVWGIEALGADGVAIRLVVKTDPAEQWAVARELRLRIKEAFDQAGIEIPFPQRTLWVKNANPESAATQGQPAATQGQPAASFDHDGSEGTTGD